ncbi:MAG TPA: GAF domain-containing protein [Vicinamibacterales bacterium]|nr:GAF domain-containing protein [Vicinamibacterales bacterium]
MRSRTKRVALSAVALVVLAGAAALLMTVERRIALRRADARAFDQRVRGVTLDLLSIRAAEQAYVAAGQGSDYWIPKVYELTASATNGVSTLKASAFAADAAAALSDAAARLSEFGDIDKRARDYVNGRETLMAADVVFTEAGETLSSAARSVETARAAEQQLADAYEAGQRRLELYGLAAAAAILFGLVLWPSSSQSEDQAALSSTTELSLGRPDPPAVISLAITDIAPRIAVPTLQDAAALCTDMGRVSDADEMQRLIGRAARIMDASGVIVWLGDSGGNELHPVLSHGYPSEVVAQMGNVPKSANNAAAAAFRTGRFQIVMARPGNAGAVVAPILSPAGCIGAFTAELTTGSETSDSTQALAAIFAAQLAGVLASPQPAADEHDVSENRSAVG